MADRVDGVAHQQRARQPEQHRGEDGGHADRQLAAMGLEIRPEILESLEQDLGSRREEYHRREPPRRGRAGQAGLVAGLVAGASSRGSSRGCGGGGRPRAARPRSRAGGAEPARRRGPRRSAGGRAASARAPRRTAGRGGPAPAHGGSAAAGRRPARPPAGIGGGRRGEGEEGDQHRQSDGESRESFRAHDVHSSCPLKPEWGRLPAVRIKFRSSPVPPGRSPPRCPPKGDGFGVRGRQGGNR